MQRAIDTRRVDPIKEYLLNQEDSYINNITIALYNGNPTWVSINLKESSFPEEVSSLVPEDFDDKVGFIHLNGEETLFVLDGQHRLVSLRTAFQTNEEIGENEIAITLIVHIDDTQGILRTRRLFTTINRYAKPVTEGESILLDEDDLSAILVRKLIENYDYFNGNDVVSLKKTPNLGRSEQKKITSIVTLWRINELLIDPRVVYSAFYSRNKAVRIRPEDTIIEQYYLKVKAFWDLFFETFISAKFFIEQPEAYRINPNTFSVRPIGQQAFAKLVVTNYDLDFNIAAKFKHIPDNLTDKFWHHILFDPVAGKLHTRLPLIVLYLKYQLGLTMSKTELKRLNKGFKNNFGDENASLPDKITII